MAGDPRFQSLVLQKLKLFGQWQTISKSAISGQDLVSQEALVAASLRFQKLRKLHQLHNAFRRQFVQEINQTFLAVRPDDSFSLTPTIVGFTHQIVPLHRFFSSHSRTDGDASGPSSLRIVVDTLAFGAENQLATPSSPSRARMADP